MSCARKPAGFSLIEAAIVLGIVGLVIGGIWAASNAVGQNRKAERMVTGLLLMVENIRTLYERQPPTAYADVTANMIAAGVVPRDFINGNNIITPYGTAMVIQEDTGHVRIEIDRALVGVGCRKTFAAFYNAVQKTALFRSGQLEFAVNGNGITFESTETVSDIMSYCMPEGNPDNESNVTVHF